MDPRRRSLLWVGTLLGVVAGTFPQVARTQPPAGSRAPKVSTRTPSDVAVAWTLPDVDDLVEQAMRRIVTQDRPGGMPIAAYAYRSFGRGETLMALEQFGGRAVTLAPRSLRDVSGWPAATAGDSLPCLPATEAAVTSAMTGASTAAASSAGASTAGASSACAPASALWLALVRIERGEVPQEIRLWYATRFRTNGSGTVESHAYSFSERWRRVRDRGRTVWRYDGFISVRPGILTAAR